MNKIYLVIWNHALMSWTVVSEYGKGTTKSSSSKKIYQGLATSAILVAMSSTAYAYDINGYTDFNSSTSISDGMQWNTTATVQVDAGADVTVSNPTDSTTINMVPADGGATSLWINGGSLTANNTGSLQMGNNSLLQIGGAQVGGGPVNSREAQQVRCLSVI